MECELTCPPQRSTGRRLWRRSQRSSAPSMLAATSECPSRSDSSPAAPERGVRGTVGQGVGETEKEKGKGKRTVGGFEPVTADGCCTLGNTHSRARASNSQLRPRRTARRQRRTARPAGPRGAAGAGALIDPRRFSRESTLCGGMKQQDTSSLGEDPLDL
jgi:hypothetical protein